MPKTKKQSPVDVDDFLLIDEHALDQEWINQPTLFYKYAKRLADAREDLDIAKSGLDLTKADLDAQIRKSPADYEIEKITEKAVEAAIIMQDDYEKAEERVRKAKHKVDVFQAAVTALDHRKKALENLVSLHAQNYFAEPRAPDKATREHAEELKKKSVRKSKRRD